MTATNSRSIRRVSLPRTHSILAALAGVAIGLASHAQENADKGKPQKLVQDGQNRVLATWAKKGMLESPVAICIDWNNNIYVAESDRAGNAVTDTRGLAHLNAVEEDLQLKSVEDRHKQIQRWINNGAFPKDYFTKTEDRVRVVRDTDGDGVADWSGVYAGGFNQDVDGIGAGVLWREGKLYYTCIPNLWLLTPGADPFKAEKRESLSSGYGVRWCFYGHDLHGLIQGPDGRIYFSMGDRGYNLTTKEGKHIVGVDRGGIFRCWPDGSGLELFYQGLRNPQKLAFDDLGELFTGDNNCDSGDRARIVYLVEGGDSGWRQDVQSLPSRGPWNREGMWQTLDEVHGAARPAWSLPPVAYMGAGPSGIAFYPGTGESAAYDKHLFMVDFYGSGSTVHSFRCDQDGAGYKLADHKEYYKGVTVTDLVFGYDGRMYLSDWGGGWQPNPNGDMFTITNTSVREIAGEAAAIKEVGEIFKAGFHQRPDAELLGMLAHRDQRVRTEAQLELAGRPASALKPLIALAADSAGELHARIHAIWAIGQISRTQIDASAALGLLLNDADGEIRAQVARTLGDVGGKHAQAAVERFIEMLKDQSPRARMYAMIALGKLHAKQAVGYILDGLDAIDNKDLTLRHAAVYALTLINDPDAMLAAADRVGDAARMGIILALRRLEHPGVGEFLEDGDTDNAIEAARAVYDFRLPTELPKLASLLDKQARAEVLIEPMMRRVIEANVLVGTPACVSRLVTLAGRAEIPGAWRLLAMERVLGWDQPLKREGVWGNWVNLPARSTSDVEQAVKAGIADVIAHSDGEIKLKALELEARFVLPIDELRTKLGDASRADAYRVRLLNELTRREPSKAAQDCLGVLKLVSGGPLQARALEVLSRADAAQAIAPLVEAAGSGDLGDRQHAVKLLASIKLPAAEAALTTLATKLAQGEINRAIALDVYEAAKKLPEKSSARAAVEAIGISPNRPAGYSTVLLAAGGNPDAGREIFLHNSSAECLRCHTIGDTGGTAGPNLTKVATRLSIEKLVESVVEPGAEVAAGFGPVSAMPLMTQFLSPREVRDVVAYLATLKGELKLEHAPSLEAEHEAPQHAEVAEPHPDRSIWMLGAGVPALAFLSWKAMIRKS